MKIRLYLWIMLVAASLSAYAAADLKGERALFLSGNQTLQGVIYRPKGNGPFPAIVFNQSKNKPSLQTAAPDAIFRELAKVFVKKGYVFFVPGRHPQGDQHDDDNGEDNANGLKLISNHEWHGQNIFAAVAWLKAQHDVDAKRVAVIGDNGGAISTVFAVEKGMEAKALILFSLPGGKKLNHPEFQSRLFTAMRKSPPILLMQQAKESNYAAQNIFNPVLEQKNDSSLIKIYPLFGDGSRDDQHRFAAEGYGLWQRDIFAFLSSALN